MDFDEALIYSELITVYGACCSKAAPAEWQQMALRTLCPFSRSSYDLFYPIEFDEAFVSNNPSEYPMTFCVCVC